MRQVNIHDAKTQLSRLLEEVGLVRVAELWLPEVIHRDAIFSAYGVSVLAA
jgi:hypothetical protein